MEQCKAKSKRSGVQCRKPPTPGSRVCHMHGSKGGGRVTTGKRSRYLGSLQSIFEKHRASDDLLTVDPELAQMDVVIDQLNRRAFDGDSPAWRQELLRISREYRKAKSATHPEVSPDVLLNQLMDAIEAGADQDQALLQSVGLADRRANRAQRERLTQAKTAATVTKAQMDLFWAIVLDVELTLNGPQRAQEFARVVSGRILAGPGSEAPREAGVEAGGVPGVPGPPD